jgi:hypothetical protein
LQSICNFRKEITNEALRSAEGASPESIILPWPGIIELASDVMLTNLELQIPLPYSYHFISAASGIFQIILNNQNRYVSKTNKLILTALNAACNSYNKYSGRSIDSLKQEIEDSSLSLEEYILKNPKLFERTEKHESNDFLSSAGNIEKYLVVIDLHIEKNPSQSWSFDSKKLVLKSDIFLDTIDFLVEKDQSRI